MYFKCQVCGQKYRIDSLKYRCECGGLFRLNRKKTGMIDTKLTLGEMVTPVLKSKLAGREAYLKLDYFMPTGSFKDRGAVVMIDILAKSGIEEIVEDSSGNAGAAIAAYAAAANIKCTIFLPADTSQGKIKQIKAYGSEIVRVPGDREATSRAVLKAAENTYYASHVYNPLFFTGTASLAYELDKNPGIPDTIFVPVGNGTMILGLFRGFKEIGRMPRLIAVQTETCSPVFSSYLNNLENVENKREESTEENTSTIAEGIAVGNPQRNKEIIKAVEESKGEVITVSEDEIKSAYHALHKKGIYIEPTAAAAPAGFIRCVEEGNINKDEKVVVPLTGSGLKK